MNAKKRRTRHYQTESASFSLKIKLKFVITYKKKLEIRKKIPKKVVYAFPLATNICLPMIICRRGERRQVQNEKCNLCLHILLKENSLQTNLHLCLCIYIYVCIYMRKRLTFCYIVIVQT